MRKCFVAMPFDGENGTYTIRYRDTYSKGITDADLVPYRVDQDPATEGIMDQIIQEIAGASVVFADISQDNPNVWFEVGYALAIDKPLIMISDKNTRPGEHPFDIRHRRVIEFKSDTRTAFEVLQREITTAIRSILEKRENLRAIKTLTTDTEGLTQMEIAALISVMQNQEGYSSNATYSNVKDDMQVAGYNRLAVNVTLPNLERKGFIMSYKEKDDWGNSYQVFMPTDFGLDWLHKNLHLLKLTIEDRRDAHMPENRDDMPF